MGVIQNDNQLGIQFFYRGHANCILTAGGKNGKVYTTRKEWTRSFAESHARRCGYIGYSFFDGTCECSPYGPQFLVK